MGKFNKFILVKPALSVFLRDFLGIFSICRKISMKKIHRSMKKWGLTEGVYSTKIRYV